MVHARNLLYEKFTQIGSYEEHMYTTKHYPTKYGKRILICYVTDAILLKKYLRNLKLTCYKYIYWPGIEMIALPKSL